MTSLDPFDREAGRQSMDIQAHWVRLPASEENCIEAEGPEQAPSPTPRGRRSFTPNEVANVVNQFR